MKIYKKQFDAKDLLAVAMDSGTRVGSTPFGAPLGERTMYIGRSVPWKGIKGIENIRALNPRVAEGISKARDMSRAHREPGVAIVEFPNGKTKVMPMKCYHMMMAAGHTVTLVGHLAPERPWVRRGVPAAVPALPPA